MTDDDFEAEILKWQDEKKRNLKTAKGEDFQVVKMDHDSGDVRYAVSLYGCYDIAWFMRKADAEKFIRCWDLDTELP